MTDTIRLEQTDRGVLLPLKVVPGSSREKLVGPYDGRLKLAVRGAPEKGRANRDVVKLLARELDLSRKAVVIVSGETSPEKTVLLAGAEAASVRQQLDARIDPS